MHYNERNLPVHTVMSGGAEIIANYNAGGYRILKEVVGGVWEYHVRDEDRTLAVIRDDVLVYFNVFGNDMFGQIETSGGVLSLASGQRYFLKDHLGSIRQTLNASGTSLSTTDYYPFGLTMQDRNTNNSAPNDAYKFTGHERDDEAGLNLDYMLARNYDPAIGRFLQIDPMVDAFPDQSPYNYVFNNPLLYNDPTGKYPECNTKEQCLEKYKPGAIVENTFGTFRIEEDGGITTLSLNNERTVNVTYARPNYFTEASAFAVASAGITQADSPLLPFADAFYAGLLIGKFGEAAYNAITFVDQETVTVITYQTPPKTLDGFPGAREAKGKTVIPGTGGKVRKRWISSDGKILEWDYKKGEVEVYSKNGKTHLGGYDPNTGKKRSPAKPNRNVEK